MGPAGTAADGRPSLGPATAPGADASDVSPPARDRALPGLLRRSCRLSQRGLSPPQAHRRGQRRVPAPAGVLSAKAALRDHGQPAQRPRSSALPEAPAPPPDPFRADAHRGLVAESDRGAIRGAQALHAVEHGRPDAPGSPATRLPIPALSSSWPWAPVASVE